MVVLTQSIRPQFETVVSVSARAAEEFARCGLRYDKVFRRTRRASSEPALFGLHEHAVLKRFNDALIAGEDPDIDALAEQAAPRLLNGTANGDYTTRTAATLRGWRTLLHEQGIRLIDAEVDLSTAIHPVLGHERVGLVCSARIDALGYRDATLLALDLKPQVNALALEESVAAWVQWHVTSARYPDTPVEVAEVAAARGVFASLTPSEEACARHRATVRALAVAVATRQFSATPGPHCRFCDYRSQCGAYAERQRVSGDTF